MKKILRKIFTLVAKPYVSRMISTDQTIRFRGINLLVKKGVFHPLYFYSTKFLIEYLKNENLENKKLLELGAGSGLISFYAETQKNAIVIASEISEIAVAGLQSNKQNLGSKIEIIASDLFDSIPIQNFDFIIINPPYYPKKPNSSPEFAWYCGEGFEFFYKLFGQISQYFNQNSKVLMILSEDCDLEQIKEIGFQHGFIFLLKAKKSYFLEENYIFEIRYSA
ncbi:MAG: methyltransferase [Spirosomataceae bacterium]